MLEEETRAQKLLNKAQSTSARTRSVLLARLADSKTK